MRILVVNSDAEAAAALVAGLHDLGHEVVLLGAGRAALDAAAPDVLVASLDDPSTVIVDTIADLLADGPLRAVPLLFTGSDEEGLAEARERFPRASFARRDMLGPALASIYA